MKQKRPRSKGEIKSIFTFFLWRLPSHGLPSVRLSWPRVFMASRLHLESHVELERKKERERERERERDETKEIEKRGRDKEASSPSSHGVCPLHVILFMSCRAFSLDSHPLHIFTFLRIPHGRRPTKPGPHATFSLAERKHHRIRLSLAPEHPWILFKRG